LQKYDLETWMNFNELFNYLPLGATISNQIYCMSSGIAAPIKNISQLKNIVRNS
jgi:diadenosine tetraphosphatase ApaH/serine/threonine PP2A family protein phosphatase